MLEMGMNEKHANLAELGDLLELAERVEASYESSLRRETLWRLVEAILFLGALSAVFYAVFSATIPAAWVTIAVLLVAYGLAIDRVLVRRIRHRSRSDRNALREVLLLLHELEGIAATEEGWTPLQRAEFRIRLSRFDLEESSPRAWGLFPS